MPNTGFLLMLVRTHITLHGFSKHIKKQVISIKNIIQLAKFKFPQLSLQCSVPIVLGTVNSCGLLVI
jgi:hypothetical protein